MSREAFRVPVDINAWGTYGRVLEERGEVKAALRAMPLRQFYGGSPVRVAALQWVMVRADMRRRGLGRRLLETVLEELTQEGYALALCYPATMPVYRSLGFEIIGQRVTRQCDLSSLQPSTWRAGPELPAVLWDCSPDRAVEACYEQLAQTHNGLVARSADWWSEKTLVQGAQPLHGVKVPSARGVVAYAIYEQQPVPSLVERYDLLCRELVWIDGQGWRALLGYLADQGRLARRLTWHGPSDEAAMQLSLDQLETHTVHSMCQAGRLLNLERALRERGYPPCITCELDMRVHESKDAGSGATLHIAISDGKAIVQPTRAGRPAEVDAGAFASIFAGWLHPTQAAQIGRLRASPRQLAVLSAIFGSGCQPWTHETF